jgi:DNA-directed RNA polymerase subunit RPC12/RpoP
MSEGARVQGFQCLHCGAAVPDPSPPLAMDELSIVTCSECGSSVLISPNADWVQRYKAELEAKADKGSRLARAWLRDFFPAPRLSSEEKVAGEYRAPMPFVFRLGRICPACNGEGGPTGECYKCFGRGYLDVE